MSSVESPLEPEDNPQGEVEALRVPDEAPAPRRREARTPRARKPRKGRSSAARETRPASSPRVSITRATLEKSLEQTIQGVAIAVTILDEQDGAIIARGEPRLTAALLNVADQNPRFRKRLEEMLEGGAYMQLAVAVGAIALPITMRHVPMPAQFRVAAGMAQSLATDVPNSVPVEWDAAPAGTVNPDLFATTTPSHEPGVVYQDEHGPYTVDAAGNVVPVARNGDGAA